MIDVVCAVIYDETGRLLACRRSPHKHLGGLWELPGGKIEPGESPAEALARELLEELGIEVEVETPLVPVSWNYDRGPIRLLPFACRILRGTPRPLDHDELRWCAPPDIGTLEWAPADLPVLAQLREPARGK